MIFPIAFYPDPILSKKCKEVTEFNDELRELSEKMINLLYVHNAEGLAAPQVNKDIRMFVALLNDAPHVFVNPRIIEFGGRQVKSTEGCLSIPTIRAILNCRKMPIHVEYYDLEGKKSEQHFNSNSAIVIQHEIDHLDGVTLFNRMGRVQRQMKKKKYLKWYNKIKKLKEGK